MTNLMFKLTAAALISALPTTFLTTSAHAHATFDVKEAEVNSYQRLAIRIGHGCDGQSTEKVRVAIPEGLISVKPMPKPGWQLETTTDDYASEYQLHGRAITSGVTKITWSGGDLKDAHYDEFIFRARFTDQLTKGKKLFIPIVQYCASGELSWSEIPAEGQDPHDLKRPAPGIMIKASADTHHKHTKTMDVIKVGNLEITSPIIRATPPNAKVAAGYLTIKNTGSEADRLIGGTASFAEKVEVHEMKMDGEIMRMREIEGGLEIPAGGEVTLETGGLHIMFMKLKEHMKEGETHKVTYQFEKAGSIELKLPVKKVERGGHNHNH